MNTFHAADDAEYSFEGDLIKDDRTKRSSKHKNGQNYNRWFTLVSETQRVSNRPCILYSSPIFSKGMELLMTLAKALAAAACLGLLVSQLAIHCGSNFIFALFAVSIACSISLHSIWIMTPCLKLL